MLFPAFKKKFGVQKISGGGGGGLLKNIFFFLEKQFFLIFTFYAIFNITIKNNIEKCPFTYWLNGRWFLHSRWGQLESISIINILYSLVLILYLKCGGGGGCNVFLTFYAIYNISRRKKNLGIQLFLI